jgi:hypothetical protein
MSMLAPVHRGGSHFRWDWAGWCCVARNRSTRSIGERSTQFESATSRQLGEEQERGPEEVSHPLATHRLAGDSCARLWHRRLQDPRAYAVGYSCGDPSSGHCYAEYEWYGGPISGGNTAITVVHIYAPDIYPDFMNNEMWVAQTGAPACKNSQTGNQPNCWIEMGYQNLFTGTSNSDYFWADNRPNGGYHAHDLGQVPAGDYGYSAWVTIWQIASNEWEAAISSQTAYYTGYSTSSQPSANLINAGTELAGSGTVPPEAVQAPRADFTFNEWRDTGGVWHYQDYHYYQSGSGFHFRGGAPPPHGVDLSDPAGSSNYGGDFYTYCC